MARKRTRLDYVPAAPISRALREWLKEHGVGRGGANQEHSERYYSPFKILADRTGLKEDTIWSHSKGDRRFEYMTFDLADKLLCCTDRFNWWWDDPELAEVYESAAKGADLYDRKAKCRLGDTVTFFESLEEANSSHYARSRPPFLCECGFYHLAPIKRNPKDERNARRREQYRAYYQRKKKAA